MHTVTDLSPAPEEQPELIHVEAVVSRLPYIVREHGSPEIAPQVRHFAFLGAACDYVFHRLATAPFVGEGFSARLIDLPGQVTVIFVQVGAACQGHANGCTGRYCWGCGCSTYDPCIRDGWIKMTPEQRMSQNLSDLKAGNSVMFTAFPTMGCMNTCGWESDEYCTACAAKGVAP